MRMRRLYSGTIVFEVPYDGKWYAIDSLSACPAMYEGSGIPQEVVGRAISALEMAYDKLTCAPADSVCFVKQIFRKSSSNSFGSQHERSSDFTKGCRTYPSFLFPSMSESVTRRLSPLNSTSLPWCTILSTSADASLSSANTVPHFPNSMLVVSTIDWRS